MQDCTLTKFKFYYTSSKYYRLLYEIDTYYKHEYCKQLRLVTFRYLICPGRVE